MNNEKHSSEHDHKGERRMKEHGMFGSVYGMAFIGAAIYFIQHSATFWEGVLGLFKAIFWPAVMMYKLLDLLKM